MASLAKAISKDLFDNVLPTFGNQRKCMPSWDNDQCFFRCGQFESKKGHLYNMGIRFSNRIAIVEKSGLCYTWNYIDSLEIYAFNGKKMELIQKKDYPLKTHHNAELIKRDSVEMVANYLEAALKMQKNRLPRQDVVEKATTLVNECYKSFLDEDFDLHLTQNIIPQLEQK